MNFFMPFNQPMMNFFNPFVMSNFFTPFANFAPQQSIFPYYSNRNYDNYYNETQAVSIFAHNTNRTSRISRPQKTSSSSTAVKTTTSKSISKQEKPYSKINGEKLAKKIVENLPTDRDPENPLCAKYVKEAVEDCGLGEYVKGNGAYCKYIFRANQNFKEIKSDNFSKLPAGSVVVYNANDKVTFKNGATGTIGKDGHVLIALGDGRGCSDILEDEIAYSKNAYTFIPV